MRRFLAPKRELGEVRASQLITTFGIGAIIDFPNDTAIIAGADSWYSAGSEEAQSRILRCPNLEHILHRKFFVKPKTTQRWGEDKAHDIPAYRFPKVLYCPRCKSLFDEEEVIVKDNRPPACPHRECKNQRLVPSRFVAVCEKGHMEDFPYDEWVHDWKPCPRRKEGKKHLKLVNMGGRAGIRSLKVQCADCGKTRGIQPALVNGIPRCHGRRPWLDTDDGTCDKRMKICNKTDSSVYMPVVQSALNIPPWSGKIGRVLQRHMDALEGRDDASVRDYIERNVLCHIKESSTSVADVFSIWKTKKDTIPSNWQSLYEDEYHSLCTKTSDSFDDEASDFYSVPQDVPKRYQGLISRVMAVTRLTEIVTMTGFTRVSSWGIPAPLFSHANNEWLPAIDIHGEGIFIELNEDRVRQWEQQSAPMYQDMMQRASDEMRIHDENISERYVLLHTLSHLLIRALAVNCGYNVSSMKERIYSTYPSGRAMSGILVYTASPDAEGSLGGLVEQAMPEYLEQHLDGLLNEAGWCSSDPLCMNSVGEHAQGLNGLNYAACPQCALLPETSCTMRNLFLDRGALIGRETGKNLGYFEDIL